MEGMQRMRGGEMSCATCHGPDASGGTVPMMMGSIKAPDIRWNHLVEEQHLDEHNEEHPAYTAESFKRAVTQGLDPSGEELHWMMPRWVMTDTQLDDLIDYLQTVE
jgi:mono/diheme cytochrome c family protein